MIQAGGTLDLKQHVLVTVSGFASHEDVAITLHSATKDLGTVPADADGLVYFGFDVPANLEAGAHTLVFQSASHSETFAFTVATSTASGTTGVTPTTSGSVTSIAKTTSGTGSSLPFTGSNVAFIAALALLMLMAGTAFVVGARLIRTSGPRRVR